MKRLQTLLWPALVGVLSLGVTTWLWQHERQTQEQTLRSSFDFGLRQTATRIEQRMASYEQMMRGVRGLFEASDHVTREGFTAYVDALLSGADSAGLRSLGYAPLLPGHQAEAHVGAQRAAGMPGYTLRPPGPREQLAPLTYLSPAPSTAHVFGYDPLADPSRREAMWQARDSGAVAVTHRIRTGPAQSDDGASTFLMFMPIYAKGTVNNSVADRRKNVVGWVSANFRVRDLMSSLYGEGTPGLAVSVHDGVDITPATLIYDSTSDGLSTGAAGRPARFQAQEYIGVAGHTWTLSVRSEPAFEQLFSNDSTRIIAIAGSGLSLVLSLLTWQLITGRERAHAAARTMTRELRDSAERYRRIVETADEGIWTVDADARTTFVNPKMQKMLGYSAEQMLGRPWTEFSPEPRRPAVEGDAALAEPQEVRFRRADGSDLWVTLSTVAIVDDAGVHVGALAMVTDITERRAAEARRGQLEAQLRQSQKMEAIGTLAGGIAHDFNNILAAILGNLDLARHEITPGHPALARLDQISLAGGRARSLVQQIVAFSRQQPQARVNQPIRPLIEETVKLLRSTLPARVELVLRLSDTPVRVHTDATQLQQVLMNLCTNAWHALQGSTGRIVIGLDQVVLDLPSAERLGGVAPGPHAHLWVSDDGSGMDEATRLRAFEPFYTTKPVGQGTGLGLSVVHGIVSSHAGAIEVHSSPGQGSCFDIYLPLATLPAEPDAVPAAEPEVPKGRGEHVLYVDDDPVMLVMVQGLLERAGYRVTGLDDPREALARILAPDHGFELIVTDFNMPDLSGMELVEALGRSRPDLPVIITSGYVSDRMRADALSAGVRHVLQKEYTLERLPRLVHDALGGGRQQA